MSLFSEYKKILEVTKEGQVQVDNFMAANPDMSWEQSIYALGEALAGAAEDALRNVQPKGLDSQTRGIDDIPDYSVAKPAEPLIRKDENLGYWKSVTDCDGITFEVWAR
jgi:hypothetical protein